MTTTATRTIRTLERIKNSRNGNPRYRITFTDGSVARTKTDTSMTNGAEYHLAKLEGMTVTVTFDSRGYITDVLPWNTPFLRDTVNGRRHQLETGCVLDGHFGWHNTYRVVREIAQPLGYMLSADDDAILSAYEKQEDSLDLPTGNPHRWQYGRYSATKTCSVCGLLPLDQEDNESECVLHYDAGLISECATEIADEATEWLNEATYYGTWVWDMGELYLRHDCHNASVIPDACPYGDECATCGELEQVTP